MLPKKIIVITTQNIQDSYVHFKTHRNTYLQRNLTLFFIDYIVKICVCTSQKWENPEVNEFWGTAVKMCQKEMFRK